MHFVRFSEAYGDCCEAWIFLQGPKRKCNLARLFKESNRFIPLMFSYIAHANTEFWATNVTNFLSLPPQMLLVILSVQPFRAHTYVRV